MPKRPLTKRVRAVYSLDERDKGLIASFSNAMGISESQAIVLAVQITNSLAQKIETGGQIRLVDDNGNDVEDTLSNTMLAKYDSELFEHS